MKTAQINVTIKTVPHPDPQEALDVMAQLIVNRIIRNEEQQTS